MPPPPREPTPRARRLIFGYQGSQFVKLLVGGIFSIVGIPFTLAFCWGLPSDVVLAVQGQPIDATVRDVHLDLSSTINDEHPTAVQFEYSVAGQTYVDESSTINHQLIDGLAPGSTVPIEYAPSRPQWARLRGTTRGFFGYFGAFALLFPALGLRLFVNAVRENRREIRAYTWGRPIAARKVNFGQDLTVQMNGRHPWRIDWEFDVDGQQYKGSLSSMSRDDLDGLAAAEQVPVLYLPEDPAVNTAYVV